MNIPYVPIQNFRCHGISQIVPNGNLCTLSQQVLSGAETSSWAAKVKVTLQQAVGPVSKVGL
jgi:hypothetical protein